MTIAGAAIALMLTGCGKGADQAENGAAAQSGAATTDAGDPAAGAKLSAYTAGYNKLLDTFGLPAMVEAYAKEEIARKSPTDSISVNTGWLEQAMTLLKTARAMPGGPADVDQAADRLIGALGTAMTRLEGLKVYYDSKAYKEDGLKRGKLEDPAMTAEFKAATTAMEQFSNILDREQKVAGTAALAALKASGDMLGYHTKLALQQTDQLVSMFKGEGDITNAAVIAKADAQVAQIEQTLATQRAELATAKAAATADKPVDVDYGLVGDQLTSVVGDYRDMKQSRDTDDFNDMVEHYNSAIEDANDIDG